MTLSSTVRRTFSAMAVPNYRRFITGQAISLIGTWMQSIAISWLVLSLTHSATDVGLNVAVQTLPVLVLGPYGGVVADRIDKRRLMVVLQSMMGLQALALGVLALTHTIDFALIAALSLVLGLNNCFENPARQSFVLEMVGRGEVRNAVSLNSTLVNAARAVGPAIGGILIAEVGVGWCFICNAVSFVAVVYSLMTLDRSRLQPSPPAERARGQFREGLAYVRRTPDLVVPLVMMALVGTFAFEFQVSLPVVATRTFHGGAEVYGFMTAAFGIGAVAGGLLVAGFGRTGRRALTVASAAMGATMLLAAFAPGLPLEFVALLLVGFTGVGFLSMGNSTLQLAAAPEMRGRVMALWAVAFLGSTPIGGPAIGWIASQLGGRAGLATGAIACLAAAGAALAIAKRLRARSPEGVLEPGAAAAERAVSGEIAVGASGAEHALGEMPAS
ncbi:MAG TPA: MFS transporter [Acidimicrobiales bacterium]|nr:MFS transporter [Acidimicrobiales bacterium]